MSLLLESLKKAALEKKEREKYSEPPQVEAQIQPHISTPAAESVHEVNQPASKPAEQNQPAGEEVELEFNIDEVEFVLEPEDSTAQVMPSTNTDSELSIADISQSPNNTDNQEKIVLSEASRPLEKLPVNEVATADKNANTTRISSFTPESGKAALAALLEKNNKVEKSNRMRRYILIGALFTTGVLVLGGYYYFLHDASGTLSPVNNTGLYVHQSNTDTGAISNPNASVVEDQSASLITQEEPTTNSVESTTNNISPATEEPVQKPSANKINLAKNTEEKRVVVENRSIEDKTIESKSIASKAIKRQAVESRAIESFIQSQPQTQDIVAQQVHEAYKAYQQGQWNQAQILYQDILLQDAYNRDAILGLAAIAARQGDTNQALNLYQQQLERDPKDEYAISGIMALSLDKNSIQLLSDVDRLLDTNPNAVHLLVLKGRLLASQQQWLAAQEVFFNAWQYDKNNADIAYNLAVCLDRLSQTPEAIRFYQMALTFKNPGVSFSPEIVEKRLAALTESSQ
jgi:tetratricopeptide (TPR) repeat protein